MLSEAKHISERAVELNSLEIPFAEFILSEAEGLRVTQVREVVGKR
jgi:hypothetical protein